MTSIIKTKVLKLGLFLAIFTAGAFLFANRVLAVGVSPSDIVNDSLMQGSFYEKEFFITRSDVDKEEVVTIEINVEGIENWFTISPAESFTLAKGEDNVSFKVEVNVPSDAEEKTYTGDLTVRLTDKEQEGQVVVVPGVAINVNLTVSDTEVEHFTVMKASAVLVEKDQPLTVEFEIRNEGNVSITPTKISMEVSDIGDNPLKTLETTSLEGEVEPFSTGTVKAIFQNTGLDIGQYFGDISVYLDEEILFADRIVFEIVEVMPEEVSAEEEKTDWTKILIYTGGGVLLVVLIGVVIVVVKKKSSVPSKPKSVDTGGINAADL